MAGRGLGVPVEETGGGRLENVNRLGWGLGGGCGNFQETPSPGLEGGSFPPTRTIGP